jgi:hypothetical protein
MPDQLFIKYIVSPLVILRIRHGDWEDNSCLGRGGYLDIERVGADRRGRKEGWGEGRGCEAWPFLGTKSLVHVEVLFSHCGRGCYCLSC